MNANVITEVCSYIEKNIEMPITIDEISRTFHYNKFYLMRTFKDITGITINQYINKQKIYKSISAVTDSDDSILKIALDNGFNSLEYYSEQFTKIIGISPLKLRKMQPYVSLPKAKEENEMDKLTGIQARLEVLHQLKTLVTEAKQQSNKQEAGKGHTKVLKIPKGKVNNVA